MKNGQLLDAVLQATKVREQESEVERVSTIADLESILHIVRPPAEVDTRLSLQDRFLMDLYHELLDEISFNLCQINYDYIYGNYSPDSFQDMEKRLSGYLKALHEGRKENRLALLNWFQLSHKDYLAGGAYALASGDSTDLEWVLVQFARAEEDVYPGFIFGLQRAKNPNVSDKLLLLLEVGSKSLQIACLEILSYRLDSDSTKLSAVLERLQTEHDPELFHLSRILLSRLNVAESNRPLISFLDEDILFRFEETLCRVLQSHPKGLQVCRSYAEKSLGKLADNLAVSIIYLVLTGGWKDNMRIEEGFGSDSEEVRNSALEAAGYSGLTRHIPILIGRLEKEANPDSKILAAEALERITGAGLTEVDDADPLEEVVPSTEPEEWHQWWDTHKGEFPESNDRSPNRYRYGRLLGFSALIRIMEDVKYIARERQLAWFELGARSGNYIAFDATWHLDRQANSIRQWKEWEKKLGPSADGQIWLFQGRHVDS